MRILQFAGGPVMTNSYVVADDHGRAMVIDPGFDPTPLAQAIKENDWSVVRIVATHGHFDHVAACGEAKALWDVPLQMHPAAAPIATTCSVHAQWFGLSCEDCPAPDSTIDHGDLLEVGELQFEVRHTPGHSPGGVCLITEGHALVGDTLFEGSIGRTDLPHSDPQALFESIRDQLMVLPDETNVYPGHGQATTIGHERRTNPFRLYWGG